MKKLMIAAAIVCAAAMSQAAATDWKAKITSANAFTDLSGENAGGTMYLFYYGTTGSAVTQKDVFDNVIASGATFSLADYAADHAVKAALADTDAVAFEIGDDGKLTATEFYGVVDANTKINLFAVIDTGDGKYYIDDNVVYSGDSLTGGTASLALSEAYDMPDNTTATAYSTPGWYSTVPEPTSGLLLLLGVAGLALRRRRA